MKIVTENLRDCIGGRGGTRYYVIKCSARKKPAQGGLTQLITYIIAHRPGAAQRPI